MKENTSSITYAENFYGKSWQQEALNQHPDIFSILSELKINPLGLLKNLNQEFDLLGQDIFQNLISCGESFFSTLQLELDQLGLGLEEQLAALFLREKFGPAGDPLVAPVFAELASREVKSRKETKQQGLESVSLLKTIQGELVDKLKLALANQINQVELEIKQLQVAETTGQSFIAETPEISGQMQEYTPKFETKLKSLKKRREKLINLYGKIGQNLAFVEGRTKAGRAIFETASQATAPSLIVT